MARKNRNGGAGKPRRTIQRGGGFGRRLAVTPLAYDTASTEVVDA